jgi:sortase A
VRLVVTRAPLSRILRWTRRALLAAAVAMLGWCAFVLADTWLFQQRERNRLQQLLSERKAANAGALPAPSAESPRSAPPPVEGSLIGRMEIPRLGLSVIVMEGVSATTLRRAAGHIPGTGMPGQAGNTGISGHRDTFFRPLRNIREDDIITLTTLLGEHRYRVVSIMIVDPHDVAVLDPGEKEVLTLVTCYPFYFVGSAPERFIVRADRVT